MAASSSADAGPGMPMVLSMRISTIRLRSRQVGLQRALRHRERVPQRSLPSDRPPQGFEMIDTTGMAEYAYISEQTGHYGFIPDL